MIPLRRWLSRPDRRDGFLVLIGVFDLLVGYAYLITPMTAAAKATLKIALELMPLEAWAALWIAAGLYSILAAFTDRRVGGFAAAPAMPFFWGLVCGLDWVNGDSPLGWFSTLLFWALGGAVCMVVGLVDPAPVVRGSRARSRR